MVIAQEYTVVIIHEHSGYHAGTYSGYHTSDVVVIIRARSGYHRGDIMSLSYDEYGCYHAESIMVIIWDVWWLSCVDIADIIRDI